MMIRILRNARPRRLHHTKIAEHYKNPMNVGSFDPEIRNIGTGLIYMAEGGVIKLQIDVDDLGKIRDAKFETFGCNSAIATGSYTTEKIKGKDVRDAMNLDIAECVRLTPAELHYSVPTMGAIKSAIEDYENKNTGCRNCPSISRCHRCGECTCVSCG